MIFNDDAARPDLGDNPFTNPDYVHRPWTMDMQWRYHTVQQARAGHEAAAYHLTNHLPMGDTLDFWRTSDHVPSHLRQERHRTEGQQ